MKTVVDLVTSLKTYFLGKDADAKQAVEANIAPVETDATSASKGYAVGKQLILNDVLYDVTAAITAGDPLTVGTNIAAADDITTQIKNHTVTTDAVPTKNSTNPVQSGGVYNSEKATREVIAPVEENATSASQGYAQGAQLILGGVLYDVTATITQGDALVVNTNIAVADDITTQIKNHTVTTDAVPTKNSTNPVQSGGVYNSEKATREVIAPVEENATSASQGYAQGAQLILGGVLYDVTATITQGDALVVNTNIAVADDIVTQFASLNQTLTSLIAGKADASDIGNYKIGASTVLTVSTGSTMVDRLPAIAQALDDYMDTLPTGSLLYIYDVQVGLHGSFFIEDELRPITKKTIIFNQLRAAADKINTRTYYANATSGSYAYYNKIDANGFTHTDEGSASITDDSSLTVIPLIPLT